MVDLVRKQAKEKTASELASTIPLDPTIMTEEVATRLGYKSYEHGGSYNNGLAPTITVDAGDGTLSSVTFSSFKPMQDTDGVWWVDVSFEAIINTTTRSQANFYVAGMSTPNINQCIAASAGTTVNIRRQQVSNSTNPANFVLIHESGSTNAYRFSGRVKLASKPTWAF